MVSSQNCNKYTRCNMANVIHHHNVGLTPNVHKFYSWIFYSDSLLRTPQQNYLRHRYQQSHHDRHQIAPV